MAGLVGRGMTYIRQHGLRYTLRRSGEKVRERVFGAYDRVWQTMAPTEAELARQRADQPDAGLISIVVPVYNTRPELLMALAKSFAAQTYQRWEACLYDASTRADTREMLRRVEQVDTRIHVCYADVNEGLSGNTNRAIEMAQGTWIVLCDHDDLLTPDALWRVAKCAAEQQPDLIYTDEDKIIEDGSLHTDPHFKPDFCPDNLRSANYVCHLMALRRTLLDAVGGLDPAYDGSQDHELTLRCIEHTDRIAHVPYVTYHWRTLGTSMSHQHLDKCLDAACRAVMAHTARIGWPCRAEAERSILRLTYEIKGAPLVSVISAEPPAFDWPKIEHIPFTAGGSDYAAINAAAAKAKGNVLLFIAPGVRVDQPAFLRELLMYAQRDDVGAVTPVLTDRRGCITHAGFAIGGENLAACRNRGLQVREGGWHLLAAQSHNVAAVSPACFMIRRDHFRPFDTAYTTALGAVDWSLSLAAQGLCHVYTPHAAALCTDSRLLLLGRQRDAGDSARLRAAHPDLHDPCYSPRLSAEKGDFSIQTGKEEV